MKSDVPVVYITNIPANKFGIGKRGIAELLSNAAHAILGSLFPEERVMRAEHGKPYFEDREERFSISHSGILSAVAVSDSEIGVDIERVRPLRPALVSKFVSDRDRSCALCGESEEEFCIRMWSAKEAYLKYTGEGICSYPCGVSVLEDSVLGAPYRFFRVCDPIGDIYILSVVGPGALSARALFISPGDLPSCT